MLRVVYIAHARHYLQLRESNNLSEAVFVYLRDVMADLENFQLGPSPLLKPAVPSADDWDLVRLRTVWMDAPAFRAKIAETTGERYWRITLHLALIRRELKRCPPFMLLPV